MIAGIVLALAGLGVIYILAGYPLLLILTARRSGPAIRKDLSHRPDLTTIVVVYNGERYLKAKLDSILALRYPRELLQILVVSDGSTDATAEIARGYRDRGVELIETPHQGKSGALNAALEHARGEILFLTDVRQPLDQDALNHLAANFADPSVGAVTGEMRLAAPDGGEQKDMDLYWRYELWVRRHHSRIDSLFNTTGCIYAIRRKLVQPLRPDTLTDDAMLPLGSFFAGYRVIFDPEAIAYDRPTVSGGEFRRRWRTLAGMWQVYVSRPQLFNPANRMAWHFLSHKFSRLLMPWLLLAGVIASFALAASMFRTALLGLEAAFVVLVLIDPLVPRKTIFKRITSPARTFVLMNAASFAAPAVFFVPAQTLWKPTRVQ